MNAFEKKLYYYPIVLEQQIMNSVKSGNKCELLNLTEVLYNKNFFDRQYSSNILKHFSYELECTVIKICGLIKTKDSLRIIKAISMLEKMTAANEQIEENLDAEAYTITFNKIYTSAVELFCYLCDTVNSEKNEAKSNLIDAVREFIHNNYFDSSVSLKSTASRFNYSDANFSCFFKENFGENFSDYLEELRIEAACRLLEEGNLPIGDIAIKVGYNTSGSFRRAFKRIKGIVPGQHAD